MIQRDTNRVRKLVAAGQELQTLNDVERTLLPLLPVSPEDLGIRTTETALEPVEIVIMRGVVPSRESSRDKSTQRCSRCSVHSLYSTDDTGRARQRCVRRSTALA